MAMDWKTHDDAYAEKKKNWKRSLAMKRTYTANVYRQSAEKNL